MKIPVIDVELHQPTRGSIAWYGTVAAMTAAGVIEWPLATVVIAGHLISENSRSQAMAGAASGAEDVAG